MPPGAPAFTPLFGAHYLKPQKSSRWPRRYVFFDTEAHRDDRGTLEVQRWRLGVTGTLHWHERTRRWGELEVKRHENPGTLWEEITGYARRSERTVVVAHNLAYDLRISQAFAALARAGWVVDRPTFSGEHVSLEARKSDLSLVFVDSLTLLPLGLGKIGDLLEVPKPGLPRETDGAERWWERCEQDVRILARAYMAVASWLSEDDLGGWARSGPGVGWHTLLRRHLTHQVLVHGRAEVREAEARAMYAGRCEVWRHGHFRKETLHVWDAELAYASVCATEALPVALQDEVRGVGLPQMLARADQSAYLVEACVRQEVPVLPYADDLGICWPTGTWTGWWWAPELALAAEEGAQVRVIRAWRYQAAPWLQSWATWVTGLVADDSSPEAAVRAVAAKHWQRAVVGRSAMKYRSWEDKGAAWAPGVGYMPLVDLDTGDRGAALTLGDRRWEAWGTEWWSQALPQLLSSVMAHCRVRLWRAIATAGPAHVVYCDTDALVVDGDGHARLLGALDRHQLWSLRYKGAHRGLEVIAPQVVEGSTYRRLAGVPKGARRVGRLTYEGQAWEQMTTSLGGGHPGEVHVRRALVALTGVDTRRVHLPGGGTEPFTVVDGVRQGRMEEAS